MPEDSLYWESGAMLCHVVWSHIWLCFLPWWGRVDVHWCTRQWGYCPFLQIHLQKVGVKEECGHLLCGKDEMQIFQISFWLVLRFTSSLASFSFGFLLVLCPAGDIQQWVIWSTLPSVAHWGPAKSVVLYLYLLYLSCNTSDDILLIAKFIESLLTLIYQKHQHCSRCCVYLIWSLLAVHLLGWLIMVSLPQSAWEKVQNWALAKCLDCNETSSWPTKLICQR